MKLTLGILFAAFVIAIIYAGALPGGADAKVKKVLVAVVIVLGLAVAALWLRPGGEDTDDTTRPKLCNGVQC